MPFIPQPTPYAPASWTFRGPLRGPWPASRLHIRRGVGHWVHHTVATPPRWKPHPSLMGRRTPGVGRDVVAYGLLVSLLTGVCPLRPSKSRPPHRVYAPMPSSRLQESMSGIWNQLMPMAGEYGYHETRPLVEELVMVKRRLRDSEAMCGARDTRGLRSACSAGKAEEEGAAPGRAMFPHAFIRLVVQRGWM